MLSFAKFIKYTFLAVQRREGIAKGIKWHSEQAFWDSVNSGFLTDFGVVVCSLNLIWYSMFHWLYVLLIDPYWYVWFTPEAEQASLQRTEEFFAPPPPPQAAVPY